MELRLGGTLPRHWWTRRIGQGINVFRGNAVRRLSAARWKVLRRLLPDSPVRRHVQGVDLTIPRSHRLPEYATMYPQYGQNLVALARRLSQDAKTLAVIDVGANVGDSALQILNVTDARVLCIEGDTYWANYLRRNVGQNPHVVIEEALLDEDGEGNRSGPVRARGTSRFTATESSADAARCLTAAALRERHPSFEHVDLIKCDTDGYDVRLIPALAAAWADSCPTLFFEYDHILAAKAGIENPVEVWHKLLDLGYSMVGIWDNFGIPLGIAELKTMPSLARRMDEDVAAKRYYYWDVAVAHASENEPQTVIREACGGREISGTNL